MSTVIVRNVRTHAMCCGLNQSYGTFIALVYFLFSGVIFANVIFSNRSTIIKIGPSTGAHGTRSVIPTLWSPFTSSSENVHECPLCVSTKAVTACPKMKPEPSSLCEKGTSGEKSPRVILHRIAGNDLPPLQSPGQLYYNIKYILEHESHFEGCEKRWVLNKMANATMRGLLLDLFLEHGYRAEQIVVNRINRTALIGLNETNWPKYELGVVALNEGRNLALTDGFRAGAKWVMPLDASQFITDQSWAAIWTMMQTAEERQLRYIKIPMFRIQQEQQPWILNASSTREQVLQYAPRKGESQLLFHWKAHTWFRKSIVFGHQDKLKLLLKVCGNASLNPRPACGCSSAYPDILEGMPGWNELTPRYPEIMKSCGYGVRLWQFPCNEAKLESTLKSVGWRPLVRMEGRQRLMFYVMGRLKSFEEMCGREHFTLMKKQVYKKRGKKRYFLCKPWGNYRCKMRRHNASDPIL